MFSELLYYIPRRHIEVRDQLKYTVTENENMHYIIFLRKTLANRDITKKKSLLKETLSNRSARNSCDIISA